MVCDNLLIFSNVIFYYYLFYSKNFPYIADTRDIVAEFLREARLRYPEMFNQIVADEPNAAQIVNLL